MQLKRKKIKNIDEYIKLFPKETAKRLEIIRELINKIAPKAQEVISYNMPAFKLNGIFVYFAAFDHHIGFYPYPKTIANFRKETAKYKTGKGSIQFPLDKPLPLPLIIKIIKYRLKEKQKKIISKNIVK